MNKWDSINLGENEKPRLSYKDKSSLNDQLKPVFESIVSSKRGVGRYPMEGFLDLLMDGCILMLS